MTPRFASSQDRSAVAASPKAVTKRAAVLGVLAALGAIAWSGCGPGSEARYYCDDGGCYTCDAYGCSSVSAPPKAPCTGTSSCKPGEVCTASGCATVCSTDAACAKGEICKGGVCTAPGTDAGPTKECTTKTDCGDGKVCVGGSCQTCGGSAGPCPCTAAADCGSGQQCVDGACTAAQNACKFSSECGDGKVCADGACLVSCTSGSCGAGFTCDKGVCKPAPSGQGCKVDTDCPADTAKCVAGTCYKPCAADPECGSGKYCDQGACVVDTRPQPNCTTDAQCGGTAATPKKCLDGFCKYTCSDDQYCRTIDSRIGYCAKDGVCRTAAEANAQCTSSADCTGGLTCIDNQCK